MSLSLDRLQRWMQAVIVHPGPVEEGAAAPEAAAELPPDRVGEVLLPSAALAPLERLGIYHAMYPLRMEEALASDYPALKHFLGDQGFLDLVRGYVQAHPSRSFTLSRLGRHLPEFVRTAPGLRKPGFCH
ncbi:MAG TPA: DNA-binding domain-containing protein, partial [Vicinamibacteria bacterium]|nr:DNA-binding domain-containing protein [Vicinamibacteria bacterium]